MYALHAVEKSPFIWTISRLICSLQAKGNRSAALLSGVQSELSDIELDIRWAIKGIPKKEAESRFAEAKRHITEDISSILDKLSSPARL
jgi:hypothetical protein